LSEHGFVVIEIEKKNAGQIHTGELPNIVFIVFKMDMRQNV
jgi:hypothetical protein